MFFRFSRTPFPLTGHGGSRLWLFQSGDPPDQLDWGNRFDGWKNLDFAAF
jgi:hypothetical protein